jgi:hypothetical protein
MEVAKSYERPDSRTDIMYNLGNLFEGLSKKNALLETFEESGFERITTYGTLSSLFPPYWFKEKGRSEKDDFMNNRPATAFFAGGFFRGYKITIFQIDSKEPVTKRRAEVAKDICDKL